MKRAKKGMALAAACGAIVLLLALMAGPVSAAEPWVFVQQTTPGGVAGSLTAGDAIDATHAWIAGGNATICSWNGTAWASDVNPAQNYVTIPFFGGVTAVDSTNVWAAGDDLTILKSDGTAWSEQSHGLVADPEFYACDALDSTNVWAVGSAGTIYHSTNGTGWAADTIVSGSIADGLRSVSALDADNAWAAGYDSGNFGHIYKRTSSGWNTTAVYTTPTGAATSRLRSVCAVDGTHFWAVGNTGQILFSSDGTTWAPHAQSGVITANDLYMVKATGPNNVWAAGNNNTILNFDGTTWTLFHTADATFSGRTALPTSDFIWCSGGSAKIFKGGIASIASVNPAGGGQGETTDVNITGLNTNFINGASAATFSGTGITVNSTTVASATEATANVTIAAGATPGARTVNVVTGTDVPIPLTDGFTVKAVYTIAATAGAGGTITPSGAVKVFEGESQPFTITPAAGYHIADVLVGGVSMGDIDHFTFMNVRSNTTIAATFSNQYSTWYLAEGSTAWGLYTSINIENPNDSDLNAKVTYMLTDGTTREVTVGLPKTSKVEVSPAETVGKADFSTKVECVQGKTIAVDRTVLWQVFDAQAYGAHNSVGVTAPNTNWYLPEGSSQWGFETWLLIQNPTDVEASCDVTYMIEGIGPKTVNHKIKADSRATFNMADEIGAGDASIQVSSNVGVIPERALYTPYPAQSGLTGEFNKREGHDSIGTTHAANDYYLAEGTTAWGFTTYVLVQNPNAAPVDVTLTCMTQEGALDPLTFTMPARSRRTVRLNDAYPNKDLSTKVHGSKPIIAERSMFWGDAAYGLAAHDSIGTPAGHLDWFLPDGYCTAIDEVYETYTLVQNPNNVDVDITVSYLPLAGGDPITFTDTVKADSRKTYNMADKFGQGVGDASILVESTDNNENIIVERSMYLSDRTGGTDTIGGFSDIFDL